MDGSPQSATRYPRFCRQCASKLEQKWIDGRERPFCPACGLIHYLNPIPSVAAVLREQGRFLLVKRAVEPAQGEWSLPGGFIELGETVEQAVVREVQEETGVLCAPLRLMDVATVLGGYYGDVIVLCFAAEHLEGVPRGACDAEKAAYFSMEDLPPLAFESHRRFLDRFLLDHVVER